ncbi:MAG TPA: Ig-like domain-containing protein [Anaerolineales bacterium]|nr:Ig-like domain-containing protein [Anaerolineales bacterium]
MKKKISFSISLILICSFLLTNCGPVTAVPVTTPTPEDVEPTPVLLVEPDQVAPFVLEQEPPAGQRLDPESAIQIIFDRDMDTVKTGKAFTFLDAANGPVPGEITWINPRTISFKPDSRLQSSTTYKAIFSAVAASADGVPLSAEIRLEFITTDTLTVGQVFPLHDAEDVDSNTNITVIFNHPVVPLQIKEEQSELPQPLAFSPEVAGRGEWVNSSVYVFQPEQPLLTGVNYKVSVERGLKDTLGTALKNSYVWQFSTRAPVIGNFALKNGIENPPEKIEDVRLDQAFVVTFLQPMDVESAPENVILVNRKTQQPFPTRLKWDDDHTVLTIEPVGRYKIASFYDLTILDSMRAVDGGTLKEGFHLRFGTVPQPRILKISPAPNSEAKDFDPRLVIKFASPMKLASLKDRIRITPQPETELQWYFDDSSWELNVYGLEPATEYVVRILPGMADIYGNTITNESSFTFKTGDNYPYARLVLPWQPLVYRAQGPQEVWFEQTNLESGTISLYPVTFDEFISLATGKRDAVWFNPKVEPIREWEAVADDAVRNEINRLNFKLQDAKEKPLPPGYYFIGVKGKPLDYKSRFYQGFVFIVATDNITLKTSADEASAWVVDLESGAPQEDVLVNFYDQNLKEVGEKNTGKDGIAHLGKIKGPLYARVEGPDHLAFTSIDWGSGVWAGDFGLYEGYYTETSRPFAYLYTDRPVYRPGQEVFFKGILRNNDDLHYSIPKDEKMYVSIELFGERVFGEYMPLSELGSFTGKFTLAEDAGLGTYDIFASRGPGTDWFGYLSFRVAEYHKPEFEILATPDKSNVLAGEQVQFNLMSRYYAGGVPSNAEVEWFLEANPYYPQFTGEDYWKFNFTDWDRDEFQEPQKASQQGTLAHGTTVTNEEGSLEITQTLGLDKKNISQQVFFRANVTDVAGNVVSGSTSTIVHQSEVYAGIRPLSYVGKQGQEQSFEMVLLNWTSNPVTDHPVNVKFVERRWYSVQTQDKQGQLRWETSVKEIPISQTDVVTDENGKATVSFVPPVGGVYKAIVTVRDSRGHTHQSSAYIWVSSDEYVAWRQTNDRAFNLIVDRDSYSPGDTAEILIAQPFEHGVYALVTYERGHVYKQDVVLLKGNSTTYRLPITEEMAPISYISVVVVSGAEQSGTPDFKVGMASIRVDTSHQELDVKVTAEPESAGPGDTITYTVETKDYSGKAVSADVSLAVVDKAALALAPSNSQRILDAFYPDQALGVRTALGIVLNAEDFNAQYRESIPEGGGSGGGGGEESLGIITVREDFKDTAFFQGQAVTDENGLAEFEVTLPENLTTWQADARAVTVDSRVGQGTGELLSTKPLFVQLQTPRFFVNGDQATVGAVIHNNEDEHLVVNVSLDAKGVELLSPVTQDVQVPPFGRSYVLWELRVQSKVNRVDFTVHAGSGEYEDSSKPPLGTLSDRGIPVYNYVATETFGTAGMLQNANSATEAIQLPSTLEFTDAQLSIEMSPSLAASMQSGLTYLIDYPYLCMEQTVSRFLPNVITARALRNAEVSTSDIQKGLDTNVRIALQRIYAKQNYDGGWNWWDGEKSDPQTTAYVVYGLIEARDSGYTVSENVLANGINFLNENVPDLRRNDSEWKFNRTAFMLYVLARADQLQASQTNFIYEYRTSLGLYGKAYLAQALHLLDPEDQRIDSLLSDLEAAAVLSAAGAHWEEGTRDYWNWNTDTRTTAIVLNAFTQLDPSSPITANAVRWLMAHREKGHWHTTQETAWSLIALTNWMSAANEYDTEYAFAIGLNGDLLEQGNAAKENLTQTVNLQVEMKDLLKETANYLVFTRGEGTGNLYYSAYLSTELPIESIEPLDQGVSLARQYFTLEDSKKPITEIEHGELVRVRLTVVVPAAVHYIVIDDPLPAGLETIDSTIQTDTAVPESYTLTDYEEFGWGWWYFTHTELHDEKVVLSADYLPAGTYVYTYLARASTVGSFQVIPPTASEFYFPDVGGRGAGSVFEVKP